MEQEEGGKQICLWAYELTIIHPTTKKEMTFKILPEKIRKLENARRRRNIDYVNFTKQLKSYMKIKKMIFI